MEKVTKEQIEAWKEKHGEVFLLEVADKKAYIRSPKRKELSASATVGANDAMKTNEFLLKACWLEGDKEIQEVDSYFLGAVSQLEQIIEVKQATIKKL